MVSLPVCGRSILVSKWSTGWKEERRKMKHIPNGSVTQPTASADAPSSAGRWRRDEANAQCGCARFSRCRPRCARFSRPMAARKRRTQELTDSRASWPLAAAAIRPVQMRQVQPAVGGVTQPTPSTAAPGSASRWRVTQPSSAGRRQREREETNNWPTLVLEYDDLLLASGKSELATGSGGNSPCADAPSSAGRRRRESEEPNN